MLFWSTKPRKDQGSLKIRLCEGRRFQHGLLSFLEQRAKRFLWLKNILTKCIIWCKKEENWFLFGMIYIFIQENFIFLFLLFHRNLWWNVLLVIRYCRINTENAREYSWKLGRYSALNFQSFQIVEFRVLQHHFLNLNLKLSTLAIEWCHSVIQLTYHHLLFIVSIISLLQSLKVNKIMQGHAPTSVANIGGLLAVRNTVGRSWCLYIKLQFPKFKYRLEKEKYFHERWMNQYETFFGRFQSKQ